MLIGWFSMDRQVFSMLVCKWMNKSRIARKYAMSWNLLGQLTKVLSVKCKFISIIYNENGGGP